MKTFLNLFTQWFSHVDILVLSEQKQLILETRSFILFRKEVVN